jgi:DNA-binding transcriptional MerR regulator/quercetin dioxygenase-like cupin family protein
MLYINQVSRLVGVSPNVLRSWEAQGLISPRRSASGYRIYSQADIERLRQIRDLIYRDRLNVAGVKRALVDAPRPNRGDGHADRDPVGARLRRLRLSRGLSLRDVSARSGLSASSISSLERSLSSPSVASLQKLAAALGTNLPQLMGGGDEGDAELVATGDRRSLDLGVPGVRIEALSRVQTQLEPLLFRVDPGAGSPSYHHEGDEFLYMLEGTFEVTLDESTTHLLRPGDSLTFESHRPHRWRNPGDEPAVIVWINTPPTF